MPFKLSKLLKSRSRKTKPEYPAEIPALPAKRQHALTPCHSREKLAQTNPGAATAHSPLFQKLPPEIRHRILIDAFGEQTVHMDLVFGYPPQYHANNAPPSVPLGHTGLPLTGPDNGALSTITLVDKSIRKGYMWRGSVCHRNGPHPSPPGHQVQPAHDSCCAGMTGSIACKLWPGSHPSKCFIGVMGWLLTCKQAYAEGIDVLYATNTLHISTKDLLMNMQTLILPQRLANISRVELIWVLEGLPPWTTTGATEMYKHLRPFWHFLDQLPHLFPALKSLYLAIQWEAQYTAPLHTTQSELLFGATQSGIFDRVETMVRKLGAHAQDFSLAVPSSLYKARRDRAHRTGQVVERASDGGKLERFWWPVHNSPHRSGYWIRLGRRDLVVPRHEETMAYGLPHPRMVLEDWILFAH